MIIGTDFIFRDDLKKDTVAIELNLDPYKKVVYRYVNVAVKENDNDTATLKFEYELFEMGDHVETALRKDKRFTEVLGLILNTLILEATTHEDGKDDIKESDQERNLHTEGSPVSQG